MSGGSGSKKRSGFQITSVTSDFNQSAANVILTIVQSPSPSAGLQGSSSQPTTPSLKRKYGSHDAATAGQGACSSSRFRVVRLAGGGAAGGGRADAYRRGRWTCTDFLEQQEGAGLRRVIDSMRHAHSLESLETIGRERDRGGVHSQDTAHLPPRPMAAKHREGLRGGPPSPSLLEPAGPDGGETTLDHAPPPSRPRPPEGPPRPRNAPPPLRLEVDAAGRSVLRLSHSQPSSPPAGRSLDRSIFSLPTDASSSSNSLVAIDNKIEQAMDLVKSHLMLAVREEVELLKEQIKELQERNQQLERENRILRVVTHTHAGRAARSSPNSVVMATRAEKLNIDEAR